MHSIWKRTYDDLHGKEVAWRWLQCIPAEYAFVRHSNAGVRRTQFLPLEGGEVGADLDNVVARAFIHVGIVVLQVVEDVLRQRAVPRANLIDDEVLVREELEQVLGNEALRYGAAVVRLPT